MTSESKQMGIKKIKPLITIVDRGIGARRLFID